MDFMSLGKMLKGSGARTAFSSPQLQTKSKSCLTHLMAFYDAMTTTVNMGRSTYVISLVFCKVFNIVPHDMLTSKLERCGFHEWTVRWTRNCLDGCSQRLLVKGSVSTWSLVTSGVPQGSVLGPEPFKTFLNDTDSEVKCSFSKSADDTNLSSAIDTTEGWVAIQRDKLKNWAQENLIKSTKFKCKFL